MKGLTKTTLWEFLELIRERTRGNIVKIRVNNHEISEIEKQLLVRSVYEPEKIVQLKTINQELSEENYQLLELHKSIISLGEKYDLYSTENILEGTENEPDVADTFEANDCIKLAIDGKLNFDNPGPCFDDQEVVDKVYKALLDLERYEDCAKILHYTRKNTVNLNPQRRWAFNKIFFWKKHKINR